jgi:hypothetical protein
MTLGQKDKEYLSDYTASGGKVGDNEVKAQLREMEKQGHFPPT